MHLSLCCIALLSEDHRHLSVAFGILGADDFSGDFTPEGNFAEKVDRMVLGHFRDGAYWSEDGTGISHLIIPIPDFKQSNFWSDRVAGYFCRAYHERGKS